MLRKPNPTHRARLASIRACSIGSVTSNSSSLLAGFCYGNNGSRYKEMKEKNRYRIWTEVQNPETSKQGSWGKSNPISKALLPRHVLLLLSFTFAFTLYLTLQRGAASECSTVVTGGDNPTDFLQDIMGNEVFTAWPTLLMEECARVKKTAGWRRSASD